MFPVVSLWLAMYAHQVRAKKTWNFRFKLGEKKYPCWQIPIDW
jgi:hypothetical protein